MFAIRQHRFGGPEVLGLDEVPDPVAGPGQVRIRVAAAGVHLLDGAIRAGESGGPFPLPELPMVPGREVAGTVDAVGAGVDGAWLGRRVVAHLGQASGGYAELAVREVEHVHRVPDGASEAQAVAMIGTGRTALAILDAAPPGPDDVVLVPAAAGGIGNLLVQASLHAGATVVGLAGGPEKLERVRGLGATHALDLRSDEWPVEVLLATDGRRPTIFYDTVGGETGLAAVKLLAPGGSVVLAGFAAGGGPTPLTSADIVAGGLAVTATIGPRLMSRPGALRDYETRALATLAAGELVPLLHGPFPLADAGAAQVALATRQTTGKVVLIPGSVTVP